MKTSFLIDAVPNPAFAGDVTTQSVGLDVQTSHGIARAWLLHVTGWQQNQRLGENIGAGCRCRMQLTLGGDIGSELVTVDAPLGGCAFPITSQRVRLDVLWTVAQNTTGEMPKVGGWISPLEGGYPAREGLGATLTEEPLSPVNMGAGKTYNVPARARAFRIFSTLGDDGSIGALQLDGQAIGLVQDFVSLSELIGHQWLASNRSRWFPLHPRTASVVIEANTTPINGITLQWILEL